VLGNQPAGDNGDVRRDEDARHNKIDKVLEDLTEDRRGAEKAENENRHDAREGRS
jgi:hypothetical protein